VSAPRSPSSSAATETTNRRVGGCRHSGVAAGVVNAFVEFCGAGLSGLSVADRATLSNMCPEYGATAALFPPDRETLRYLEATGREPELVEEVRIGSGQVKRDRI